MNEPAHILSRQEVLNNLNTSQKGLSEEKAKELAKKYGKNALPKKKAATLLAVFFRQFLSPFIYILLIAAIVSFIFQKWHDAVFIGAVLLINAIVGTIQEYSAQQSAQALQETIKAFAFVLRDGKEKKMDAENLVPGDIVFLQSGDKIPADVRLLSTDKLTVNESLLTGESEPVVKDAEATVEKDAPLGDRNNMAFAGTWTTRGRGKGVVVATGVQTQIGHFSDILESEKKKSKPPLLIRMQKFTYQITAGILVAVALIFLFEILRGSPWKEVFILSVALAISAIPGGLPIAVTVALALGARRMAKRNVIVRRLVAVESLGSCTYITSDKTGTLTVNKLTVREIQFPGLDSWEVSGEGLDPDEGEIHIPDSSSEELLHSLLSGSVLCNEGFLYQEEGEWKAKGDAVDAALLVLAAKAGVEKATMEERHPQRAMIPYESENQYAASLNRVNGQPKVFVKGAVERLLEMCQNQISKDGHKPLQKDQVIAQSEELAEMGFRVLGFAEGVLGIEKALLEESDLKGLAFVGMVGMIDPLRPEVQDAVKGCQRAGIEVSMVTGDHPKTALAIARQLRFAERMDQVVTGTQLKESAKEGKEDDLISRARVFARVEPEQKVDIVHALKRQGHFIAATGDGANDAPALSAANVGVAMGKRGTDVARESSEILLTDDNFASIVDGIEEGRIAYRNVRKVIFLLISTSAAEVALIALALLFNLPLPLIATQILWLNMITNGIQDVALALEPKEGDEMEHPPRSPKERIFNAAMIERVAISGLFMGGTAFCVFQFLLRLGWDLGSARNSTLLLMVLFENVNVFNSRSESLSVFRHPFFSNPVLLIGTAVAQLVHIGAMYAPWISNVLEIKPISFTQWCILLGIALTLLIVMEIEKLVRNFFKTKKST